MTTLKRLRDATGLTREEFAQLAGVTVARLEKHEQGKHRISLDDGGIYAIGLSKKLHSSPSKLLAELAGIPEKLSEIPDREPASAPLARSSPLSTAPPVPQAQQAAAKRPA